jgi:hypothetical protein
MFYGNETPRTTRMIKLKVILLLYKLGVRHPNMQQDHYDIMGLQINSYYYYDTNTQIFYYIS